MRLKSTHRFCALLTLAGLAGLALSAGSASLPQKGYELAGTPRPEFLLEELRAQIGKKYWVRRPFQGQSPKALFCDSKEAATVRANPPACTSEKYGLAKAEQFTIEDVVIAKPNPALSWMKIRLASGKTTYMSPQDFTENRYREGMVAASAHNAESLLNHSGWIFNEYPETVLNRRLAQQSLDDPGKAQERLEKDRVARASLLHPGMTAQQVLNSSWGRPNSVNVVTEGQRSLEQWDYGAGNVLYFDRGRLHHFQANR
jgi:hypothetical protein